MEKSGASAVTSHEKLPPRPKPIFLITTWLSLDWVICNANQEERAVVSRNINRGGALICISYVHIDPWKRKLLVTRRLVGRVPVKLPEAAIELDREQGNVHVIVAPDGGRLCPPHWHWVDGQSHVLDGRIAGTWKGRKEKRKSEMKFLQLGDTRRGQENKQRKIINLFLDHYHQAWDTYPRNVTKVIKTISQTIRYVIKTRIPVARPINSGPKECGSITTRGGGAQREKKTL